MASYSTFVLIIASLTHVGLQARAECTAISNYAMASPEYIIIELTLKGGTECTLEQVIDFHVDVRTCYGNKYTFRANRLTQAVVFHKNYCGSFCTVQVQDGRNCILLNGSSDYIPASERNIQIVLHVD